MECQHGQSHHHHDKLGHLTKNNWAVCLVSTLGTHILLWMHCSEEKDEKYECPTCNQKRRTSFHQLILIQWYDVGNVIFFAFPLNNSRNICLIFGMRVTPPKRAICHLSYLVIPASSMTYSTCSKRLYKSTLIASNLYSSVLWSIRSRFHPS